MTAIKDFILSALAVAAVCAVAWIYPPALWPIFWMICGSAVTMIAQNAARNRRWRKIERMGDYRWEHAQDRRARH